LVQLLREGLELAGREGADFALHTWKDALSSPRLGGKKLIKKLQKLNQKVLFPRAQQWFLNAGLMHREKWREKKRCLM
jgi:hypothetical protein